MFVYRFYRQTNPPRISFVHPLGALKARVPAQRTALPLSNKRGEAQRAPSLPQNSLGTESGSYAEELYRHALARPPAASSPSPPVSTSSAGAAPPPVQNQWNLPLHMRQMLSGPQPPADVPATAPGLPTLLSPAQVVTPQTRSSSPHGPMSVGYTSAVSSRPAANGVDTGSGGTRNVYTTLQPPPQTQTLALTGMSLFPTPMHRVLISLFLRCHGQPPIQGRRCRQPITQHHHLQRNRHSLLITVD